MAHPHYFSGSTFNRNGGVYYDLVVSKPSRKCSGKQPLAITMKPHKQHIIIIRYLCLLLYPILQCTKCFKIDLIFLAVNTSHNTSERIITQESGGLGEVSICATHLSLAPLSWSQVLCHSKTKRLKYVVQ
jgi:hypothetical protein